MGASVVERGARRRGRAKGEGGKAARADRDEFERACLSLCVCVCVCACACVCECMCFVWGIALCVRCRRVLGGLAAPKNIILSTCRTVAAPSVCFFSFLCGGLIAELINHLVVFLGTPREPP